MYVEYSASSYVEEVRHTDAGQMHVHHMHERLM